MSLGIVIPVWNDSEGLKRLLQQIASMGIAEQVVIVDDGSAPAHRFRPEPFCPDISITLIEQDTQRGAGYARNRGLQEIHTQHVIFFDSDDLFLDPFADLYRRVQNEEFDFCIFRHIDSRERSAGHPGLMPSDQELWTSTGIVDTAPSLLSVTQAAALVLVAAYPWNKIYRTDFLRSHNIRCTETMVHNDIELHWHSFLVAKRILASTVFGAEHLVSPAGARLTNRNDAERLRVFETLAPLHGLVREQALTLAFTPPLMTFYTRLFAWITDNLDAQYLSQFHSRVAQFVLTQPSEDEFSLLAVTQPQVAQDLLHMVKRGLQ